MTLPCCLLSAMPRTSLRVLLIGDIEYCFLYLSNVFASLDKLWPLIGFAGRKFITDCYATMLGWFRDW